MDSFSSEHDVSSETLRDVVSHLADKLQSQDVDGISRERVELLDVPVSKSNGESMFQFPHVFEHRHRDHVV